MKSAETIKRLSLLTIYILIAGSAGIKAIRSTENDIRSLYLLALVIFDILIVYVLNKKMEPKTSKWGVKPLFMPLFVIVLYSSYQVLPIGNPDFSTLNNVLILLFYFQLLFLSGVITKRENT